MSSILTPARDLLAETDKGVRVDFIVREPDFVDPATKTAGWIGDDAMVEVLAEHVDTLALRLHTLRPVMTETLAESGITLTMLSADVVTASGVMEAKRATTGLWRIVRNVVTQD